MTRPSNDDTYTPGTGWTITDQIETQQLNAGGSFVDGYKVGFTTQHGVAGSVFVPRSQYRPDIVARMVREQAALIDQVHTLDGSAY